jgi:CHAT domain-containing protein
VLIVAEPNLEGNVPLPNATAETEMIKEKIARKVALSTKSCVTSPLRLANILEEMEDASVIHLACHGQQDPEEPLASGFLLQDGLLTMSHIIQLKLQKTHFAFLAACESASGDREQPDEAIHLGAAMLFMGVKSVIGTLW